MPSSSHQNSEEPSGLLGTLATVFSGVLFGLFLSKLRAPIQESSESVCPEDTPEEKNRYRHTEPATISQIPPTPAQQNPTDRKKDDTPLWKKIIEIAALPIAIGLLLVNFFQLRLTQEQVHKGQRAYLVWHHAVLDEPLSIGKSPRATIELLNSGQTPAIDASYFLILEILPAYPVNVNYGTLTPMSPIGAGQTMKPGAWWLGKLEEQDLKDITAEPVTLNGNTLTFQNKRLFLFGIVRYKDIFGEDRESQFCAIYWQTRNVFMGCPTHNDLK